MRPDEEYGYASYSQNKLVRSGDIETEPGPQKNTSTVCLSETCKDHTVPANLTVPHVYKKIRKDRSEH